MSDRLRREPQNNQEVFTAERRGTIWSERLKPEGVLPGATAGEVESSGRTEGGALQPDQLDTHLFRLPSRPGSPAEETLLGVGSKWRRISPDKRRKEKIQIKVAEGDGAGNSGMQATTFVETTGKQEERQLLGLEMPS